MKLIPRFSLSAYDTRRLSELRLESPRLFRERKLEMLLRLHRRDVFHENEFLAECHGRAIGRLKKTQTFLKMCERQAERCRHLASERLLRLYA